MMRIWVSLASDPEPAKNTWLIRLPVNAASRSASSMVGTVVHWKKLL